MQGIINGLFITSKKTAIESIDIAITRSRSWEFYSMSDLEEFPKSLVVIRSKRK
jgi:hypothetical protein